MRPFEYMSPTTAQQVPALLGKSWGEVEILAGGSDLLSLMKDEITTPKRLVNIKSVAGLSAIVNLAFITASPVWSTLVIALDVIVIYAIVVHGGELKRRTR